MNVDASSSYNNLGPVPTSSPYETNSSSHLVPSPSWSLASNSINCNSLRRDSATHLSSARREAWNSVRITGFHGTLAPVHEHEHKRQRISIPDGSSLDIFRKVSPGLGSQVNGHPASDSGYATRSARSMSRLSTFPAGYAAHPPMTEPSCNTPYDYSPLQNQYFYIGDHHSPNGQSNTEAMPQVNKPLFACDVARCGWAGKCLSDKKKHMIRHEMKFHCGEKGCTRKVGFGSVNDLERHRSSVHKKPGNGMVFKCVGKNCTNKEKIWFRKDNFKQHLGKLHKDENTDELIQRSISWYESTNQSHLNSSLPISSPPQEVIDPNSYRPNVLQNTTQINNRQSHPGETIISISPQHPPGIRSENQGLGNGYVNCNVNLVPAEPETQDFSNLNRPERIQEGEWDGIEIARDIDQPIDPNEGRRPSLQLLSEMIEDQPLTSDFDSVTEAVLGLVKALGRYTPKPPSVRPQKGSGNGLFKPAGTEATPTASQQVNASNIPSYVDRLRDGPKTSRDNALRELLKASLSHLDHLEASQANTDVSLSKKVIQTNKDGSPRRRGKKIFVCRYKGCTRKTGRLSEMKKHEKRHSRPYGCTYPRCFKSFGSKNDWKRHENTQHFQLQCWRCPVKIHSINEGAGNDETLMEGPDQEDFLQALHLDCTRVECSRIFDRKDKFCHHLQSEHFYNERAAKQAANDNEIGRNGQFKFWCGFCRKLIKLNKDGLDAWDERFDHIDNEHFKNKQNISDWIHPEGHLTRCEETEQIAGNRSATSEELEAVETQGANCSNYHGGEERPTKDKSPDALILPTGNIPVSVQPFAVNSNSGPPPRLLVSAAARQNATRVAQATKRKYDSGMASSPSDNNAIAHRTSPFSTPMMHFPQRQMISTQVGIPGGAYPVSLNPFVPNVDYTDLNGLIPVENNLPSYELITCVSPISSFLSSVLLISVFSHAFSRLLGE
ncbi:hypothetical protein ACJ72_07548 [Emergomyces africanus]|uniref:C2H2-type domain-containing protein n=1 Tax=Emergomyces africanus TaxID=1955775 RepID=A0A1B7NNE1_9EURO|nr:hypothetical protein ACJ72_07548 [Emergomyces africanus]